LSFVKDVLDYKVTKTKRDSSVDWVNVEEILTHKVSSTQGWGVEDCHLVGKILNQK